MAATVDAGPLTVSAPASTSLGAVAFNTSDQTASAGLGAVSVTDDQGAGIGFTATASATVFTGSAGTLGAATYVPGTVTVSPDGTAILAPTNIVLTTEAQTVEVSGSTTGVYTATWDPTITVLVPGGSNPGTYTSTLTESAA
jgi:hypothetical protein